MLGAAIPGSPTRTGRTPVHRAGGAMSKQGVWLRRKCVYHSSRSDTHAGRRHLAVDRLTLCL